jgi:hypothetical protein
LIKWEKIFAYHRGKRSDKDLFNINNKEVTLKKATIKNCKY